MRSVGTFIKKHGNYAITTKREYIEVHCHKCHCEFTVGHLNLSYHETSDHCVDGVFCKCPECHIKILLDRKDYQD